MISPTHENLPQLLRYLQQSVEFADDAIWMRISDKVISPEEPPENYFPAALGYLLVDQPRSRVQGLIQPAAADLALFCQRVLNQALDRVNLKDVPPVMARLLLSLAEPKTPEALRLMWRWFCPGASALPSLRQLQRWPVSGCLDVHSLLHLAQALSPAVTCHLKLGAWRYPLRPLPIFDQLLKISGHPEPHVSFVVRTPEGNSMMLVSPFTERVKVLEDALPNFELRQEDSEEHAIQLASPMEWAADGKPEHVRVRGHILTTLNGGEEGVRLSVETADELGVADWQMENDGGLIMSEIAGPPQPRPIPGFPTPTRMPSRQVFVGGIPAFKNDPEPTTVNRAEVSSSLSLVRVFLLTKKKYAYVDARDLQRMKPDPTALDRVKLPDGWREVLLRLANGPSTAGIAIAAFGGPGVGKTLTGHMLAAALGLPLYDLTATDLMPTPHGIQRYANTMEGESRFEQVLRRVRRWNAVLLIDECEGVLGDRLSQSLSASDGAVAGFLRVFDQLPSLVFMTTNMPGRVDPAVRSRLSLVLPFPELDEVGRRFVWVEQLGVQFEGLDAATQQELVALPLDGRRIRNLARALRVMGVEALKDKVFMKLIGISLPEPKPEDASILVIQK